MAAHSRPDPSPPVISHSGRCTGIPGTARSTYAGRVQGSARMVASRLDGGLIEVFSVGDGPGVVVVGGGGTDASTYRRLAERLSTRFMVHVYNRRGRGSTVARPADYSLATEVDDLAGVLADTGAARLIGHSVGGLVALAAARDLPVERAALFDPAVSVEGSFPSGFLPDFEQAIAQGDALEAMLIAGKGLRNPGHTLPDVVQRPILRAVMATPDGRTMLRLIDTVPAETRLTLQADGPAAQWADVAAETRFYIGARSPDYYHPTARDLVAAMPHATIEIIPRLGHDAVARATTSLTHSLIRFLT